MGQRVTRNRPLTEEEKRKYREIRQQVADEMPEIKHRAQLAKPRVLLKHMLHLLKQERERQGLSLTDVHQRTGLERGVLIKLESNEDLDVTMNALLRYADAIGKTLTVQIEDVATS